MDIVIENGLPVEAINSIASYFLQKIENYKNHLIPYIQNENFTLFIPDLYLYIKLKVNRLSESDIEDIRKYIQYKKPLQNKDKIRELLENYKDQDKVKALLKEL